MLIGYKTKQSYKRAMQEVVNNLGRNVIVYKQPIKHECPNCYYDKTLEASSGKCRWTALEAATKQRDAELAGELYLMYKYFKVGRCPVCLGKGYLETHRRVTVNCLVNWNPSEDGTNEVYYSNSGTSSGILARLKTDPKYLDLFNNSYRIIVDGMECKLSKPCVVRGLGNQTVLVVIVYTTSKMSEEEQEQIKNYD